MLFLYKNQQVTRYTVVLACISFSAHRELHTFCNTFRDFYGYYFFTVYNTFTGTFLTLVFDDFAFTATSRTSGSCLHGAEYGLLVTDYRAATVTGRAGFGAAVAFGSRAMTVGTRHVFLQLEFLFHTGRDFLEVQFYLDAQVRTTVTALLCAATSAETSKTSKTSSTVSAKDVTEHGEDVVHGHASTEATERTTITGGTTQSGMTELIVAGTLVRIA